MLNADPRGRRVFLHQLITSAKLSSPNTIQYLNLFWSYSIERAARERIKTTLQW